MTRKPTTTQPSPPTYEQAMDSIEQIIHQIENGQIGLEESLNQCEQGMKLIAHCRSILDRAQKRIEKLTVTDSGNLRNDGPIASDT